MKIFSPFVRVFFLTLTLLSCFVGVGQTSPINETFSNVGSYGGYQFETWTGDQGGTWTATDARTDRDIGNGKAIMIRNGELTSPSVSGGVGDLTVTTERQFSGGSGNMDLRVNGVSVGPIPYDGTIQTTTINGINILGDVIVVIDATNSSSDRVVIDDLSWTGLSGPENPSTFIASATSTTQVDLDYDDNADGDDIIIVFATDNSFSTPTGTPPVAGNAFAGGTVLFNSNGTGTYNHTSLTPNTTYYYKAWSYDGTDYSGGIEDTASTPCNAINSFPFTEGFEGGVVPPNCWTSYRGTNGLGTNEDWQIETTNVNTGSNAAYVKYENVTGGNAQDWLVTPPLDLSSISNPELSFFAVDEYEPDYGSVYSIRVSTTSQTDISSFSIVETYNEDVFQNYYSKFIVDLSAYDGQTIYIAFVMEQDDGDSWYLDDIEVRQGFDKNTQVNPPSGDQVASGSITADVNTNVTNRVDVFKFEVEDQGTFDNTPTEITQLRFVPGADNDASWAQNIQGLRITRTDNGNFISQPSSGGQTLTINDNEIIVEINNNSNGTMTVTDGTSVEYLISIFLKDSNIEDEKTIQLSIPSSSLDWETATTSSVLQSPFSGVVGNPFTIDVVGNGLEFISDASTTIVNEAMSTVQVANTDSNGNIDLSLVDDVEVESSGTLTGEPIIATPNNGIAIFSGLIHTIIETGLVLTATTEQSGVIDGTSSVFDIIELPELFITEIADPNDFNGRFVEIFNAGVSELDLSNLNYFIVRERNGGPSIFKIKLDGIIPAKGYFVIGRGHFNGFSDSYGFGADQTDPSAGAVIAGNGNDSYFISTDDTNNEALRNSQLDIFGEIGINGFTNTDSDLENNDVSSNDSPWEYEDSRAYRNNPTVKNANTTWSASEWTIENSANIADMTPGYGDNDYIYVDDTNEWDSIGLGNPNDTTPTTAQNIFVRAGTVTLTQDSNIGDLVVRSGATLTIEGLLTVTGDIVNEGKIIFTSTAAQTAVLGEVAPNTRVVGDGFEIHRYYSGNKRSFRYVSTPVHSTENINANWQEGATDFEGNPKPGYGTHITGSQTGDNGFDQTDTGNPSMFTWNHEAQSWVNIDNTDIAKLVLGQAYALMVRGDRSISLDDNSNVGDETILRSTGEMHVGTFETQFPNIPTTTGDKFVLVGNPYQAQVDVRELTISGLDPNYMYIWDPQNANQFGGYATVDLTELSNTTPAETEANERLQPGQAFFMKVTASTASVTFEEDDKTDDVLNLQTFSVSEKPEIYIALSNETATSSLDAARVVFGDAFSTEVISEDATKLWNSREYLAIEKAGKWLSIEKMPLLENDSIQLFTGNYQHQNYQLKLEVNHLETSEITLFDRYLDEFTPLENGENTYAFSVDQSISASTDARRFQLIVDAETMGTTSENSLEMMIYPNPVSNGLVHIQFNEKTKLDILPQITIFDLLGNEMTVNHVEINQHTLSLDVNGLGAGVYLLKVTQGENQFTHKLIVRE